MKYVLTLIIILALAACAYGQEEPKSVLVNPPAVAAPAVQPVAVPRHIIVFQRGWFGKWRATPMTLVTAVPVVVQPVPQPTIIWTPQVIWR